MTKSPRLRLGTRNSPLAMAQAIEARERLCAAHGWGESEIELVPVVASGDKVLDRPLAEIGGKALWTKELDQWLATGEIDVSVHSMKDVETIRPPELMIAAILPRADRRDVLVGAESVAAIPSGARIGTSAPRRAAQMLHLRPDCTVVGIRGNVATRLAKLEAGEADVTMLARAGLDRLEQSDVGVALEFDEFLPAPAQGAIGLECRTDDHQTRALMDAINCSASNAEVMAERALLFALGGNCHSSIAVLCQAKEETLTLRAALFSADGRDRVADDAEFAVADANGPLRLAQQLLARSPDSILSLFDPPQ